MQERVDVALALQARLQPVDAAGDVDREDQFKVDRNVLRLCGRAPAERPEHRPNTNSLPHEEH